jgi:hypothetical protein
MNQLILCHFSQVIKDKLYQFSFQPGQVVFDDIEEALESFKSEVAVLKQKALEAEEKSKEDAASNSSSEPALDAEVVQK